MIKNIFRISAVGLALTLIGNTAAFGATNEYTCQGVAGPSSYACLASYGYVGEDGFDVDRFDNHPTDVYKHSCTSFAAFMVYKLNPTLTEISTFDSAQFWDTQSVERAGADFGSVPHVGDIAQWEAAQVSPKGHVAYVENVIKNTNGSINHIIIADDNSGLRYTTRRKLYPGVSIGVISWPHGFITFHAPTPQRWGTGKPPFELNSTPLVNE
jgi:hypothetical protein